MNRAPHAPPLRDIVLLGGGHAHVQVLKTFGMAGEPGLRLTVVAREAHSPYSGMLPGLVAGHYAWDDIHIDLARLAAFAGARFVAAEATGLDAANQRVTFDDRPPLRYDVLSVNTGGVPGACIASSFVTPVKPIGRFLPAWQRLASQDGIRRLVIVGGGPGGVELALAISQAQRRAQRRMHCTLIESGPLILAHLARGLRRRAMECLARRGVEVLTGAEVSSAEAGEVRLADGRILAADHVLRVTGVEAPDWPAAAGLATDDLGFIVVNRALQSTSHAQIFAAGDVASMADAPRPKSGVYAVRQGPILAANLRRFAVGEPLRRSRPQKNALAIIGLGDGRALGCRGRWHVGGRWVWRWKQWLDQRFMRRFNDLPTMPVETPTLSPALRPEAPPAMRCGGCGAKIGADILQRVLRRLDIGNSATTLRGIGDDAAVIQVAAGRLAVSCDGFRAMIDDGYRFGRVAAHHALNDIFAMGAKPSFALALATVPSMAAAMMEEDLFQMMAGALAVFRAHGVDLVGGHSAEAAELGIAFTVSGLLTAEPFTKDGLSPGDQLLLTKPIGSGALLAGAMQGKTRADDLLAAIDSMDTSNAQAAQVLRQHGVRACTDVTGFGFAGHLTEMTRASAVGADVVLGRIPTLSGALELMAADIVSSLQVNNEQALNDFELRGAPPGAPQVRLLADPQTAGGLLAGVAEGCVEDCLRALRQHGYPLAEVVGAATETGLRLVP